MATLALETLTPAIQVNHLTKTFAAGRRALDGVSLRVRPGEMVALIGTSGSGKSTLLRHISGLVGADRGRGDVRALGRVVQQDGTISRQIQRVRADIGFVFQQFNLVGRLSLLTNVLTGTLARVPLWRSAIQWFTREEKALAMEALNRVCLADHALQRASTLSGGQQQRGAIARTLVQRARIILADEPIASLDPESSRRVMEILSTINREDDTTVLVSLHQVDFALRYCPRTVALKAGRVVYDGPSEALTVPLLRDIYNCTADAVEETGGAAACWAQDGEDTGHFPRSLSRA
jgi:phosphonate transport system ATP-binding protein